MQQTIVLILAVINWTQDVLSRTYTHAVWSVKLEAFPPTPLLVHPSRLSLEHVFVWRATPHSSFHVEQID